MKTINAEKVTKVLNWIIQHDDEMDAVIEPTLNKYGFYECSITLPIIEKTIIGLGDRKIDSIENATSQASILIDDYLANHPSEYVEDSSNETYILEENDEGLLSMYIQIKH